MIKLPKKCEVNKFLPKKIFYEKIGISSGIKNDFTNLVEKITWLYKLSPDTIGISKTEEVEEIQIFQIDIKDRKIPVNIIKFITKVIPYKILFIVKCKKDYCYVVKVDNVYYSEWNDNIKFEFNAINLEVLYENIVKSIIKENSILEDFNKIIENENRKIELNRQINIYKNKIHNEKQFNRKVELNIELNKLEKEMEELLNE